MRQRLKCALSCLVLCALLAGSVTVPAQAAQFSDVPDSHPAAEAIRRCVELGFFQGESPSQFGLGHPMTRAAFVVVLSRFFDWETVRPAHPTYTDVPADAWCYDAVEAAAANGALTEQTDTFRPTDPLTREELAVMLVRALGYGTIAGLVQELSIPYRDVRTNLGYIVIAYDLDLVDGTSATTFSPDQAATREELAVLLMRLYDKLHAPAAFTQGLAESTEGLPAWEAGAIAAVPAGKLMYTGGAVIAPTLKADEAAALRDSAKAAGAVPLLYIAGGPSALNGGAQETAQALVDAVSDGGYDGLFLDIPQLKLGQARAMNRLAAALKEIMPEDMLLYLMAEAPTWYGKSYEGYDFDTLNQYADRLVLRIASPDYGGSIPTLPIEPLEELYYALGYLRDVVPREKLSLLVTTSGTLYLDESKSGSLSRQELDELLADKNTGSYYSSRYACAYLTATLEKKDMVVWYLDQRGIQERAKMAGLFGLNQILISNLNDLPRDLMLLEDAALVDSGRS